VVGGLRDRLWRLEGVFVAAYDLRTGGGLEPYHEERLNQLRTWFNEGLPTPPFSQSGWGPRAVCWYRDDAIWMIRRTWELVLLLREHGRPVRFVQTDDPGRILYRDDYQIVADDRGGRR
jgi:hypothetical protein